ncbi:MAG: acyltransferase family protein [Akkermansiaceae bacterium]
MSNEQKVPIEPIRPTRLDSLDVYRGFVMFWIIGGGALAKAFSGLKEVDSVIIETLAIQLQHVKWEGFRFYDLIFPSFIFIVGASLVYSLGRYVGSGDRRSATVRVVRRGLILWLIGIIYYGGISKGLYDEASHQGVRLLGVLQRIGICYLVTGFLFLYVPVRGLVVVFLGILAGYWALLAFVPVPGQDGFSYDEGRNLTNWFDSQYLPFFKWRLTHDPEGILSTFPAIATCLLGVFAGILVKGSRPSRWMTCGVLIISGACLIGLGNLWGIKFPVIKNIWTSSFVFVAGGWSLVLLGVLHGIVDLLAWKKWAMPFVWVGTNSIAIYLLTRVVDFNEIASWMFGGPVAEWADGLIPGLGKLVVSVAGLAMVLWLCRTLYRNKLFFKV